MADTHRHQGRHGAGRHPAKGALAGALAITLTYTIVEIVGGVLTDSLALLSDAAHMVTDNVALALALFAVWLAAKPASPQRSFGFRRAEVLAALANGITLVAVAIWVFVAAVRRFAHPVPILGGWMLVIAVLGLLVNVVTALLLRSERRGSINVDAAFRHIIGDLAGSLGTIVAAAVIVTTGWTYADPLVSILIGLLILASSWAILRGSVTILMEGAPQGLDVNDILSHIRETPGVVDVHDLHVWIITTGFPAIAAHVTCEPAIDVQVCRKSIEEMLNDQFGISHATLQMEEAGSEVLCTLLSCGR